MRPYCKPVLNNLQMYNPCNQLVLFSFFHLNTAYYKKSNIVFIINNTLLIIQICIQIYVHN